MKIRKRSLLVLSAALCGLAAPLRAWDATGHEVAARIAWEAMKPATRAKAVALLEAAPPDADLASLLPDDGRPRAVRERELFELASTWPDIVRDKSVPARLEKYHHATWHYIDFFWEPGPHGEPKDRPDLRPDAENAVERLHHFERTLGDASRPAAERAVDLAWVLHVTADIHQPLHTCARVTPDAPQGDQGGNLVKLDGDETLHWYWDRTISRSFEKPPGEDQEAYVGRVAHALEARHPRRALRKILQPGRFEDWVKKGYETCKTAVYPASLQPGTAPSAAYARSARRIAGPAVALAGYRLAAMLDRLLR